MMRDHGRRSRSDAPTMTWAVPQTIAMIARMVKIAAVRPAATRAVGAWLGPRLAAPTTAPARGAYWQLDRHDMTFPRLELRERHLRAEDGAVLRLTEEAIADALDDPID